MAYPARLYDLPQYTYTDYAQWEGRWELIYGIPYAMSPQPRIRHQEISGRIHGQLLGLLAECTPCRPLLPVDWRIGDDIVVQPDNLVVCEEVEGAYLTVPPILLFEVLSPSTAHKDRHLKRDLYAAQRVPYYVLVDPETNQADVLDLQDDQYVRRLRARTETVTFALGACTIHFDVSAIW